VSNFRDLVAYQKAIALGEAFGRSSRPDQLRFLLFARGSAYELQHWIERGVARKLITGDDLRGRAWEVGRLVNGLHRSLRTRSNN
jgi:four helix bundle protein